jgi:hypothetical protein
VHNKYGIFTGNNTVACKGTVSVTLLTHKVIKLLNSFLSTMSKNSILEEQKISVYKYLTMKKSVDTENP